MRLITIDFETYWDSEHTLTKMSPMAYVMSPKTEIICAAIKVGAGETQVFFGESEVRQAFAGIDWGTSMVVAHNMSGFDSMILAWRFGVRPKMWACTLAMARPMHSKTTGNSLAKLVAHYKIGVKNQTVLTQTKGKNLKDFTQTELADMRRYNQEDTDQCYALFNELKRHYSTAELWQIDATIRMLVEPAFSVNRPMLEEALVVEIDRKRKSILTLAQHLKRSGIGSDAVSTAKTVENLEEAVRADLASSAKFATLLRSLDVAVPMKPSPTNPSKEVPALAKTDEAFLALQEHDNEIVAAAARGRLAVKSTLLETRIGAFLEASAAVDGKLPVPLNYCGADTTGRWSGWAYNCMPAGHEVLTPGGWVDISDWEAGTPIMQWWPDGTTDWCSNPGKVEHHHKGEMVRLTGPFVRGLFTPDHRVPKTTKTKVSTRTAAWIATHSGLDGVPAAGVFVGTGSMGSKLTPDQVRLMVATAADGCLTREGSLRWGFKRNRKIARIQQLLDACGIDAVRKYDYREKGGHWVAILAKGYVPSWLTKGFDAWVLSLSREALDALVDELKYWDGMKHSRNGNTCFFTSVEDQALWVSTALHLSGTPARVGARSQGRFDVYARSSAKTSTHGAFELFDGMVYCPQVDSSFFLVRHQGAIHVTGNCQNLPRINPKSPKVSDALRNCMQAPPGHKIIVSDLSGIELRVNHFLWKVKESIDLYKSDPEADLYRAFAAARYRVTPEEVTKDQRQLAKMCLAEGTLVLTDEGEVPIEQVTARHRVWDGVEWVSTLGAIYKGERDVIEYDGITATPDHEVWVEDGRKIPVRAAAAQSCRLARTGAGGVPLGFGGVGVSGSPENQGAQARTGSLHVLRDDQSNQLREPSQGGDERLPELLAKERRPGVAATAAGSGTTTLHQPERRRVQAVWGTGDTVSIRDRSSGSGVGGGEHRLGSLEGVGSNRQQRELRSGQHALGYEETKHSEPDQVEVSGVPSVSAGAPRGALRGQHAAKPTEPGTYVRADPTAVEPTIGQTKRRVWDLLNCGPRHRFTANGRLVSNCQLGLGFGAGWRTFQKVAKLMGGLELSEEDAEAVTVAWRAQYAEIVRGWKLCHASLGHIYDGVEQPIDPWGLCVTCAEGIRLPTGRIIRYPDLRSEHNEDGSKEWVYGRGRHKARIYAGKVDENCVQALARDVIAGNALDFFKRTKLRPALMVHDELVYVVPESDAQAALDELQAIMRTPPKWWSSLVTWSEGDVADTYGAAK